MKAIILMSLSLLISTKVFAEQLSDEEDHLRHLKTVLWPQAYRTQDVNLLDQILDDSFEMIGADGTRSNKEAELRFVADNKWNPSGFKYIVQRVSIYDHRFAIIDGHGDSDTYSYASSNVLIKRNGKWKAIASHVSGFMEK